MNLSRLIHLFPHHICFLSTLLKNLSLRFTSFDMWAYSRIATTGRVIIRRYAASLPDHKKIIMPKVSPTMTAGRLVEWKKREGDSFNEGEDIADVESDKATMPITAMDDGFIARIFVPDDTPDIPLGQLLAITVEEQQHVREFGNFDSPSEFSGAPQSSPPSDELQSSTENTVTSRKYEGPIGPAVMHLLGRYPDLNLDLITPTGPNGRILKGDVLAAIDSGHAFTELSTDESSLKSSRAEKPAKSASKKAPQSNPVPDQQQQMEFKGRRAYTDVPVTSMRRAIAKRLSQSKSSVPHRYASAAYNLDALLALRKRLNTKDPSPRISVNDFVIKAVALSLVRVPEMNVCYNHSTSNFSQNKSVDISMAVAIDGGLITPIVFDADKRGLGEIANATKRLVENAKRGTLDPEEYEGGCFSISNLGMFGVSQFSAIINPPQCSILAVGAPCT